MMKRTKRILAVLAAAAITPSLLLAACGKTETPDGDADKNDPDVGSVKTYTITFDANNGHFEGDKTQVTATTKADGTVDFPAAAPEYADHTFGGYNFAADGTGTSVSATTVFSADTTVYALWDENNADNNEEEQPPIDIPVKANGLYVGETQRAGFTTDNAIDKEAWAFDITLAAGEQMEIYYNGAAVSDVTLADGSSDVAEISGGKLKLKDGASFDRSQSLMSVLYKYGAGEIYVRVFDRAEISEGDGVYVGGELKAAVKQNVENPEVYAVGVVFDKFGTFEIKLGGATAPISAGLFDYAPSAFDGFVPTLDGNSVKVPAGVYSFYYNYDASSDSYRKLYIEGHAYGINEIADMDTANYGLNGGAATALIKTAEADLPEGVTCEFKSAAKVDFQKGDKLKFKIGDAGGELDLKSFDVGKSHNARRQAEGMYIMNGGSFDIAVRHYAGAGTMSARWEVEVTDGGEPAINDGAHYLVGGVNDWQLAYGFELTATAADGVYRIDGVELKKGDQFKIVPCDSTVNGSIDWETAKAYTLNDAQNVLRGNNDDSNLIAKFDGTYILEFDTATKAITVTYDGEVPEDNSSDYYLRGTINGWAVSEAHNLQKISDTVFRIQVTVSGDFTFKVADASWSDSGTFSKLTEASVSNGIASGGGGVNGGKGTNITTLKGAGVYTITLTDPASIDDATIDITWQAA